MTDPVIIDPSAPYGFVSDDDLRRCDAETTNERRCLGCENVTRCRQVNSTEEETVPCANCGKPLKYKDSYTKYCAECVEKHR